MSRKLIIFIIMNISYVTYGALNSATPHKKNISPFSSKETLPPSSTASQSRTHSLISSGMTFPHNSLSMELQLALTQAKSSSHSTLPATGSLRRSKSYQEDDDAEGKTPKNDTNTPESTTITPTPFSASSPTEGALDLLFPQE
jgi:hypothetical protein